MTERFTPDNTEGEGERVETKYGTAFKNPGGAWCFQWRPSRGGTPPECTLEEAASRLPREYREQFCDVLNRALEEAGKDTRIVGGPVSPRRYLG